jgi:SAM-dependent methyltransferase
MNKIFNIRKKTIKDFNNQWKLQGELNDDYWASDDVLIDQFDNIYSIEEVTGKIIADVGAGTGRVVKTFLKYNPKKIFAIEPSDVGISKINQDFKEHKNLQVIQSDGLSFKTDEKCDYIFSLGVIHHIKEPTDVLNNIRQNLKKNGKIIIWVYGYENNFIYICFYKIFSKITKYVPDKILYVISNLLNLILQPYIFLCRYLNLPLKNYLLKVFNKFGWSKRNDVIFDQLNPEYAKYYKKDEILKELTDAGFSNITISHRHNYSWTVIGENI